MVARLRSSPSRLPAARRRRQLLDVAIEVFATHGFHRTSMDDVADAAGVTKPVLYQHFSSKRQLYLELLDDVGVRLVAAVTGAVDGASGPRQQVEAGFGAYFRFVAQATSGFRLLFGGGVRRDEEFADAVRQFEDNMAESVAALIEADIEPEHRRLLGYGIVGLAETAARHWVDSWNAEEAAAPDVPFNLKEADRMARRVSELAWAGLRGVHRD
jgi:AcrR family transcriptional regulator